MKLFIGMLMLASTLASGWARPAQVIIIRHAEKPKDPEALHLSGQGERRAMALVDYLTKDPELTRNGLPVALFAVRPTRKGHGLRAEETIDPLAKRLGVQVETPFLSPEYKKLARSILSDERYQGKTVLICWTHEYLPDLAAAFGARPRPADWDEQDYDRVYSISYEGKRAVLKELSENLSAQLARKEHKGGKHHSKPGE